MKREKVIENLVSQFAENARHLSDEVLDNLAQGKLAVNLVPAVGEEAGGATAAAAKSTLSATATAAPARSTTTATATTASSPTLSRTRL